MQRLPRYLLFLFTLLLVLPPTSLHAQDQAVVRAILFYSPTCPHCHKVIQEGLPPLVEQYGDQLQIVLINTQTQGGSELYAAAADWGGIPPDQRGVPLMVVGDKLLFGDVEIPARLPGIVDEGLSNGGIDWPAFPGMADVVAELEARQSQPSDGPAEKSTEKPAASASSPAAATATPAVKNDGIALIGESEPKTGAELSISERLMVDPVGSTIALVVLALLIISAIWVAVSWIRTGLPEHEGEGW